MKNTKGSFTLPGESGYEDLTLKLAEKWGADVIRDSDGTELSPEIVDAGYGIYSTICIIRNHNDWAKKNPDKLQQTFLISEPVVAENTTVTVNLMDGYFSEQFSLNDSDESVALWQVFDRTTGEEVRGWEYSSGAVIINNAIPFHKYTVNFLAYRIWEEISMYNHVTNNWNTEHMMQIDPVYPETQEYMMSWMRSWCESHPKTTVVRFTSMFYNFVWIWSSYAKKREVFSDWGSYDFTVSPKMLDDFGKKYGYNLTSEDFINGGNRHATHCACPKRILDYMEFVNSFVIEFGKKLVDIVHSYGKKAYVFYDDSWVGVEPWGKRFGEFGFDGLIKCVYNAFEARLCAGVKDVDTHEIRLHPYLFPVGLGGAPTFAPGGNPTADAKSYWKDVRRALLRDRIDRIGLGGYLSLTLPFPDFNDYIEKIADEFRAIKDLHISGKPYVKKPRVAVLTFWGKLRSWICSGHYNDSPAVCLIDIIEALAGMPLDVEFISFDDLLGGALDNFDVVINAGAAGTAWSGAKEWENPDVTTAITEWVYGGGVFLGVNEPSAVCAGSEFRMSHVLGVDYCGVDKLCHGKFGFDVSKSDSVLDSTTLSGKDDIYIISDKTKVLLADGEKPVITRNDFGKGVGLYMSSFKHGDINNRTLLNLILESCGDTSAEYLTDNPHTECGYYPNGGVLVVINNSADSQTTTVKTQYGDKTVTLDGYDAKIMNIK